MEWKWSMACLKKEDSTRVETLQGSSRAGADPACDLMRRMIPQLLEEELTAFLKAELYLRTEERRGYRFVFPEFPQHRNHNIMPMRWEFTENSGLDLCSLQNHRRTRIFSEQ
jgi:hypothetical protein